MLVELLQYKGYVVGPTPGSGINAVVCMEAIEHWNHATDPQPTQQQIATWATEPEFLTWLATHGGDPLLTLRREAQEFMDDSRHDALVVRAALIRVVSENNTLRQWITDFKAAVAASTSLANFQARVAALDNLPQRTAAQIRTVIKQDIADGIADT